MIYKNHTILMAWSLDKGNKGYDVLTKDGRIWFLTLLEAKAWIDSKQLAIANHHSPMNGLW